MMTQWPTLLLFTASDRTYVVRSSVQRCLAHWLTRGTLSSRSTSCPGMDLMHLTGLDWGTLLPAPLIEASSTSWWSINFIYNKLQHWNTNTEPKSSSANGNVGGIKNIGLITRYLICSYFTLAATNDPRINSADYTAVMTGIAGTLTGNEVAWDYLSNNWNNM